MRQARFTFEIDYYEDYRSVKNRYVEFCSNGARKYVHLPTGVKTVELVFSNRDRADSFEIRPNGKLVGVGTYLMESFQDFLRVQHREGWRYVHIEY